jgi:hypothetical protein
MATEIVQPTDEYEPPEVELMGSASEITFGSGGSKKADIFGVAS